MAWLTTIGGGIIVWGAVFGLACWIGLPTIAALILGGLACGVAKYLISQWAEGRPIKLRDAVINAAVTAVIAVASGWAAELVAPAIESVVAPAASLLPAAAGERAAEVVAYGGIEALIKRPIWAGAQVVENVATQEPLPHGVIKAAVVETLSPPEEHAEEKKPAATVGITGSLDAKLDRGR